MTLSPFKTVSYQLYLFQLENYRIGRFLKLLGKNFGQPAQTPRKQVVWTLKLAYLFSFSMILQSALSIGAGYGVYLFIGSPAALAIAAGVITFYVFSFFFFLVLIPVAVAYMPLDYLLKQRIIRCAKAKMARVSRAKIIGITGSYGKTTMKEALAAVLSEKFKVLKTPENINTPLGVSRLILDKLGVDTEIFVVEMGAYQKGDIKTICDIVQPDISMVTGINESHLERFGNIENTIKTKFEIVDAIKRKGLAVLNADDKLVAAHYKEYVKEKKVIFYSSRNNQLAAYQISEMRFFEDGSGISFYLASAGRDFGNVKIPLLGEYAAGIVMACVLVAQELGMSDEEIRRGIANIKSIPHRLELLRGASGTLVIDDSYNGNPDGAAEAIRTLAKFTNRRKIYITPGLVEMGGKTKEIHYTIGKELAQAADVVVLIKNSVTPFIAEALAQNNFSKDNILWFDSAPAAHGALPNIVKPGDVIMFQNDWPDNYF